MTAFDKHQVACFRFVRCDFAADTGVAQLVYAFDNGPELVETVSIPGAPFVLDAARAEAVQRALRLLHLFAGVSYYKAAVPEQVRIDSYSIDADTAALVETVYLNGLGEFAYRNGLNLRGRFRLPASTAPDDVMLIADAGAYGYVMANTYNQRELPREDVIDDGP